jgi:hypothetical protein
MQFLIPGAILQLAPPDAMAENSDQSDRPGIRRSPA